MLGHTWAFNVFLPAFLPLGAILTALALWPFIEQWITGDRREHHICERPRNAPTRTALGMGGVAFYGIMWLEGANDVIAYKLNISLYLTTEIARYAIFIGPVVAYWLTKRICLGLQRKDVELLSHGVETGIIRQLPSGEYTELTRPVDEDHRAVLTARTELPHALPSRTGMGGEVEDVPARSARGGVGRLRLALNRALTESIPLPEGNGHGDGHGNGHAGEPAAVGAPSAGDEGAAGQPGTAGRSAAEGDGSDQPAGH
jgi:ubiquinol-cytochrome c reductase cytochrome b subunit